MPGSIIKLKNGKYRLFISHGFDRNGKAVRHTKVIAATSDRDANKQLGLFYNEVMQQPLPRNTRYLTFEKFIKEWWDQYGNKLSPSTQDGIRSALRVRLLPYFGPVYLTKIKSDTIATFFSDLADAPQRLDMKDGTLSDGSIYNLYKTFRGLMGKAVELGYIGVNPCSQIPKKLRPKKIYRKRAILQLESLRVFLHHLNDLPDTPSNVKNRLITRIILLTGLRRGEVFGLCYSDFDFTNMTLRISKSACIAIGKGSLIKSPKTISSDRTVYIDEGIKSLLLQHKENEDKKIAQLGFTNPNGYVFTQKSADNNVVKIGHASSYYHWLSKFLKNNNLPQVCVHALRHMAASYSLANGVPLTIVKDMMGHTSIETTNLYLHSVEDQRKDCVNAMAKRLNALAIPTENNK